MGIGRREFLAGAGAVIASSAMARPIRSSLGGRLEYEGGEVLPYDSEVAYLENTGTQWIDTGDVFDSAYMYEFGVSFPIKVFGSIFGARSQATYYPDTSYLTDMTVGGVNRPVFYATHSRFFNPSGGNVDLSTDTFHTFCIQVYPTGICTVDGVNFLHGYENIHFRGKYSILLFGLNNAGAVIHNRSGVRVNKYRVLDGNNSLVHNFVPVRFTNEQGVIEGAMYDRASGELFRNQGTGSFIIGPDIS